MNEDTLYNVDKAAKLLGMSPYMVRHWTRKGELHHERVEGGRNIVFRVSEVNRFRDMISGLVVHDVAAMLGVSADAVRAYVTAGKLPARKALGELRFDLVDVQKFAEERGIQLHLSEERKSA